MFNFIFPLFLFLCYAETHYRFRFFVSYLKKHEPEIIADVPFRVESGQKIPVLLLIKDAHKYPIHLKKMSIKLHTSQKRGDVVFKDELYFADQLIDEYMWNKIWEIDYPEGFEGDLYAAIKIEYKVKNKIKACRNDNHRTSSHRPFKIYISPDKLPAKLGWFYGDIHYHSSYTDDHVEFGAPLKATKKFAKAMGLKWFAPTDHSYDLDDYPTDYLNNDPTLQKWRSFISEVNQLNSEDDAFAVIAGEEISAGNSAGKNVHLLAFGIKNFIPGKGDSAEEWFHSQPTLSLPQIYDLIEQDGGIAFAAHPLEEVPWIQKALLRRGQWKEKDFRHPVCTGLQIWNGAESAALKKGIKAWVKLLLTGQKKYIVAGNDAHGNFNRFRQVGVPFFKITEKDEQIFGNIRTAIYCEGEITEESCFKAISHGRAIITNGPFICLDIANSQGEKALIGDTINADEINIEITAISTSEFGNITNVNILQGDWAHGKEEVLYKYEKIDFLKFSYHISLKVDFSFYVRAEVVTDMGKRAFTNPIWVYHSSLTV